MFEYNFYSENSSEKFIEACNLISKNVNYAEKKKVLIDVDGTTIQEFLLNGKSIIVYDDYDVGAVYIKSDISLEFFNQAH